MLHFDLAARSICNNPNTFQQEKQKPSFGNFYSRGRVNPLFPSSAQKNEIKRPKTLFKFVKCRKASIGLCFSLTKRGLRMLQLSLNTLPIVRFFAWFLKSWFTDHSKGDLSYSFYPYALFILMYSKICSKLEYFY